MRFNLKVVTFIILIAIVIGVYTFYPRVKEEYSRSNGLFVYSGNRGNPDINLRLVGDNVSFSTYEIGFTSRAFMGEPVRIAGLLFLPKSHSRVPGVVILPGGGQTKEKESELVALFVKNGTAVLIIDERGLGKTGGTLLPFEEDVGVFERGFEPIQHLAVYDALRAFDVLASIRGVDEKKISLLGISMGGRYAIIAGSMEPRIKQVIVISTSGFHAKLAQTPNPYLVSIDPDEYIKKISPRYFYMLHGSNDSVIPIVEAKQTFSLANEPKVFFEFPGCKHGYCPSMNAVLTELTKS
jgi:uncharacterized protein